MAFSLDHCLLLNTTVLSFTVINQIMSYRSQGDSPLERHSLKPALSQKHWSFNGGIAGSSLKQGVV